VKVRMIIDRVVFEGFDPRELDGPVLEARLREALEAELRRRVSLGERYPATLPDPRSTRLELVSIRLGADRGAAGVGGALGGAVIRHVWNGVGQSVCNGER
jgi:hypothetical protein